MEEREQRTMCRSAELEEKIQQEADREMRWMFWYNLKKTHPLIYEITQWTVLAIAIIALIINIVKMG